MHHEALPMHFETQPLALILNRSFTDQYRLRVHDERLNVTLRARVSKSLLYCVVVVVGRSDELGENALDAVDALLGYAVAAFGCDVGIT